MQRNDCYNNCKLMLKRALIYLFTIILLHVESDANVQFFFFFDALECECRVNAVFTTLASRANICWLHTKSEAST